MGALDRGRRDGMRHEVDAMRNGLTGRLAAGRDPDLAAIRLAADDAVHRAPPGSQRLDPLADVAPDRARPGRLLARRGPDVLRLRAAQRRRTLPLYRERYVLLTAADGPFADHAEVAWAEAARTPLCLLTEDMQNRRIVDELFQEAGARPRPVIETNSISTLYAHTRDGTRSKA